MNIQEALRSTTDDEILEELNRRKRVRNAVPKVRLHVDCHDLVTLAKENVEHVQKFGDELKDIEHWSYECMMKTVFGDNIFDWINANT